MKIPDRLTSSFDMLAEMVNDIYDHLKANNYIINDEEYTRLRKVFSKLYQKLDDLDAEYSLTSIDLSDTIEAKYFDMLRTKVNKVFASINISNDNSFKEAFSEAINNTTESTSEDFEMTMRYLEHVASVIDSIHKLFDEPIDSFDNEDFEHLSTAVNIISDELAKVYTDYFTERPDTNEYAYFRYLFWHNKNLITVLKRLQDGYPDPIFKTDLSIVTKLSDYAKMQSNGFKEAHIEFSVEDGFVKSKYVEQEINNEKLDELASIVDDAFAKEEEKIARQEEERIQESMSPQNQALDRIAEVVAEMKELDDNSWFDEAKNLERIVNYHCDEDCGKLPMERHEFSLPIGDTKFSLAYERFIRNMVAEMKELEYAIQHQLVDIPGESNIPRSLSNTKARELADLGKAITDNEAMIKEIANSLTLDELFDIDNPSSEPNYVHVNLKDYAALKLFVSKSEIDIRQLILEGVDGLFYDLKNDKIIIKYINGVSEFPTIVEYYKPKENIVLAPIPGSVGPLGTYTTDKSEMRGYEMWSPEIEAQL